MQAITRFVLRHKALVALVWLLIAVAGVMTVGGTTHRMTNDFSMPGQAFKTDNQIVAEYGNGGSQAPYVPVLTVPAGQRVTDPAVAAQAGRVFGAIAASTPGLRVADYSSTQNAAFVTRDGRTTFALVFTPPSTSFGGPDAGRGDHQGRGRGAARGLALRADRREPARQRRAVVQGHRDHGRDDDRLCGRARGARAGIRLVPRAAPAAGRRGVRARHVPDRRRAHRDHRDQPDRRVPHRPCRPRRGDRLLAARGQPLARGAVRPDAPTRTR